MANFNNTIYRSKEARSLQSDIDWVTDQPYQEIFSEIDIRKPLCVNKKSLTSVVEGLDLFAIGLYFYLNTYGQTSPAELIEMFGEGARMNAAINNLWNAGAVKAVENV